MKFIIFAALLGFSGATLAESGMFQRECAGCHNITGPAVKTLKAAFEKKGPDLFYAGNKYRKEWLIAWLQEPYRIRPAGMYYGSNIKPGFNGDDVDTSMLTDHVKLSKPDATMLAIALMQLKPYNNLIAREKIEPGTVSSETGEMVFDKFLGCLACHLIEPGYGGRSGPELYTAARRLQPEFIASFVRNPQAWEPKTWMPNKHVTETLIPKLVYYFDVLSQESQNAK